MAAIDVAVVLCLGGSQSGSIGSQHPGWRLRQRCRASQFHNQPRRIGQTRRGEFDVVAEVENHASHARLGLCDADLMQPRIVDGEGTLALAAQFDLGTLQIEEQTVRIRHPVLTNLEICSGFDDDTRRVTERPEADCGQGSGR